jgi:hypothetical protein
MRLRQEKVDVYCTAKTTTVTKNKRKGLATTNDLNEHVPYLNHTIMWQDAAGMCIYGMLRR